MDKFLRQLNKKIGKVNENINTINRVKKGCAVIQTVIFLLSLIIFLY